MKPIILPTVLSVLTKVAMLGQPVIHNKKSKDQKSSNGKRDSTDVNSQGSTEAGPLKPLVTYALPLFT